MSLNQQWDGLVDHGEHGWQYPRTTYADRLAQDPLRQSSQGQSQAYHYRSLRKNSIRVLKLRSSSDNESILAGELVEVSLDQTPAYEAVSYAWEGQTPSRIMLCEGCELPITANAEASLKHFRPEDEGKTRTLWIDAICINQKDERERDQQVAIMWQLYKGAQRVLAWLSNTEMLTADNIAAFAKLSTLIKEMNKPGALSARVTSDTLHGDALVIMPGERARDSSTGGERLNDLVQDVNRDSLNVFLRAQSWCNRLWTVQEVAVSKQAILIFHEIDIDFRHLLKVFRMLRKFGEDHPSVWLCRSIWTYLGSHVTMSSLSSQEVGNADEGPGIHGVMDAARWMQVSDPKDKIYAIHGLLINNFDIELPAPNYSSSKPVAEVYCDTTVAIIRSTGNLEILEQVHGFNITHGLPSWVPDWAFSRHPKQPTRQVPRADGKYTFSFTASGSHLRLTGLVLDIVSARSDTSLTSVRSSFRSVEYISHDAAQVYNESPDREWSVLFERHPQYIAHLGDLWNIRVLRNFVHFVYQGQERLDERAQQAFFECLFSANEGPGRAGGNVEARWLDVFRKEDWVSVDLAAPSKSSKSWMKDIPELSDVTRTPEYQVHETIRSQSELEQFHLRAKHNNMYQTLFRTASDRLGIAPYSIEAGDQIILIPGLQSPMIIRQDGMLHHRLITPAYIHGVMDGMKWPPDESQLQDFTFV